ncbi:MAG: sulfur carrier protein ThiS [Phycisphaerales bacterium]|nr:sulfur carrier protein ThiS [Phycisphaerales bacterium]
MRIMVNGAPHEANGDTSVSMLLESLGLSQRPCAVEVNADVIPRNRHATCTLQEGDRVELVTLVGGG